MRGAIRRWLAGPAGPEKPLPSSPCGAVPDADLLASIGRAEESLLAAVAVNVNTNDRALYNLLWCYRLLRQIAAEVNQPPCIGTVLEIGTSPEPGLPLIALLDRADRFVATNVMDVADRLPEAYVRLVYLVMSGLLPVDADRLDRVVRWEGEAPDRVGVLRDDVFTNLAPKPAEDIDLPAGSVDVSFSFSVLEHVKRPRAVLENMFRLMRPGGWTYHTIDLRDHRDFTRPVDFLTLSEDDYAAGTENRVRASQWLDLFIDAGFEIHMARYMDAIPELTKGGMTDLVDLAMLPLHELFPRASLDEIEPWVTEDRRRAFAPPFDAMDVGDLSATSMCLACRKGED